MRSPTGLPVLLPGGPYPACGDGSSPVPDTNLRAGTLVCLLLTACATAGPPAARTVDVTDTHHGVTVADPYRWLEDGDSAEVKAWTAAQNAWTRSRLDALPALPAIRERVREIATAESVRYRDLDHQEGRLFALKRQPDRQQPLLVVMPSADEPEAERVLLDPEAVDPSGATHIDWFVPSPDGRRVAVSLSVGGTESGDVHVWDVETGAQVFEVVPRVNGGTAGGSLAWTADGAGFFYTRYPREGERPAEDLDFWVQVWFHTLGQTDDRPELTEGLPRIAELELVSDPASGRVLATVQYGDSGRFAHHVRGPEGGWTQLTGFDDEVLQAVFGPGDTLYLVSRAGAPRGKVERLSLAQPGERETLIPQGEDTVLSAFGWPAPIVATTGRLYVTYQLGGPAELRVFDHEGRRQAGPELPAVSSVGQIVRLGGDAVLVQHESYISPPAWYRFDGGATAVTKLAQRSPVDFSDTEVVREWARSKDGTRVPVNVVRRKGTRLDGSSPLLLTGYGGYGLALEPYFSPGRRVFIEQGGVYAVANLRGGGEFGREWHEQGRLTTKQNVFDDFAGVMGHLVDLGYTRPERLAIVGGSNGGLLMGATLVQHPERCRAVASFVGIYDMLRVELSPNGEFNIPEFGTVKDEAQFRALFAYSPYHHVASGTAYPAVLLAMGENDPRVEPMQSRKMAARLQAASTGEVLLRSTANTGHGGGTPLDERIAQQADMYAFLLHHLGVTYRPVR